MKHLVVIGLVLPEPNSTAAGHRLLQLIRVFKEDEYKITFLSAATPTPFSEPLEYISIELNNERFDNQIKELNPDVVLFDRYITEEQFGWRVQENCPNSLRVLDTEDLHFLREARRTAYNQKREFVENDYYSTIFKRELASILRCDLSLIISEFEYNLLTEKFKLNPEILFYIPFLTFEKKEPKYNFKERKNFISIGNFLHEPNWQTVLKLKSLWKSIKSKLPDAQMHIYGAYVSEKVKQLHDEKSGFLIKGRADSVEHVFNSSRVLLAPIPFGAGLKGKLWESMIYSLPNITSSIGAEGMTVENNWNGFIEDKDSNFTDRAVELYTNESIWCEKIKIGHHLIEEKFLAQNFRTKLLNTVENIQDNLNLHRQRNFLGLLLSHQTANATKYMSKWIEAKNKG